VRPRARTGKEFHRPGPTATFWAFGRGSVRRELAMAGGTWAGERSWHSTTWGGGDWRLGSVSWRPGGWSDATLAPARTVTMARETTVAQVRSFSGAERSPHESWQPDTAFLSFFYPPPHLECSVLGWRKLHNSRIVPPAGVISQLFSLLVDHTNVRPNLAVDLFLSLPFSFFAYSFTGVTLCQLYLHNHEQ
jgi:hypothetical protein